MRSLLREQGLEEAVEVDSAGTGDWHVGNPMDRRAAGPAADKQACQKPTPIRHLRLRPALDPKAPGRLGRVLAGANCHDSPLLAPTLDRLNDLGPLPEEDMARRVAALSATATGVTCAQSSPVSEPEPQTTPAIAVFTSAFVSSHDRVGS